MRTAGGVRPPALRHFTGRQATPPATKVAFTARSTITGMAALLRMGCCQFDSQTLTVFMPASASARVV
jgi:hypothetical protein